MSRRWSSSELKIRQAMKRLGKSIAGGDQSQLLHWIITGALACAHRPLRYHSCYDGSRVRLPTETAGLAPEWVTKVRAEGIESILSLMHDGDLGCYAGLDLGAPDLIEYFRTEGFSVAHHPYEDPAISSRARRISGPLYSASDSRRWKVMTRCPSLC